MGVTSLSNIIKSEQIEKGNIEVLPLQHAIFDDILEKDSLNKYDYLSQSLKNAKTKYKLQKPLSKADKMLLQAESLLTNAKNRVAEIERDAYEKGFAEGERGGIELGRKKLEPIIKNLDNLAREIAKAKEKIINENEIDLIKLSFLIASKIIHFEIQDNNDIILNIAKTTLEKTIKGGKVTLCVNPTDYQYLIDNKSQIPQLCQMVDTISIERDPAICRGGCIVLTNAGEIDASIENQIKVLKNATLMTKEE